jgi:alpha-L-rhamnosidase
MLNSILLLAASWITALSGQGEHRPAVRLARDFVVAKPVATATLEASALGLYKPFVNAREITDRRLMPGWTQYDQRVLKQSFDVTQFVKEGTNTLAALVGRGWFAGMISSVGLNPEECGWRRHPAFWAELNIEYKDGTCEIIGTDQSWRSAYLLPALLENDIYLGEEYDASFDDLKWKMPLAAGESGGAVIVTKWPGAIEPDESEGVRVMAVLKAKKIIRKPSGKIVIDYGENLSGVDRVTLKKAHPGLTIVIRHGEILDKNGDLWRDNLVFARQETRLTCGDKPIVYEPSFTFYGYRYAEVSGWPADEPFDETSVQAVKISSVGRRTGYFRCSNELVNKFFANVLRSQEDNFVDVPTDCPQRCERFAWTGDAQVFCETAMMNYDVRDFFRKWIRDLNLFADHSGGTFTVIAPYHTQLKPKREKGGPGSAGWADAGVVCPWMYYRKYGDRSILERSVEIVERYVDLQDSVETPSTIGDHLALGEKKTSSAFVAEALRIEMMRLTVLIDKALGRVEKACHFEGRRAARLREFQAKWFDEKGELKERTQTSAAFAVVYGLSPSAEAHEKAGRLLVEEIRKYDTHLTTGFLGTPILLRALTEIGETALAYELLEQTTCPSWLYPVTMGATSIWERWDAIRPDGTHHPNWMNSFNHYAFGSAASWLYDTVCGIRDITEEDPSAAGFRRFRLSPHPGGTLKDAEASLETSFGMIRSSWKRSDGKIIYDFTVPVGTTAELILPGERPVMLKAGTHHFVR